MYGNHEQLLQGLSEIFEFLKAERCCGEIILDAMLYSVVQECMVWSSSSNDVTGLHCKELSSAILAFMASKGDESFLEIIRQLPSTFDAFLTSVDQGLRGKQSAMAGEEGKSGCNNQASSRPKLRHHHARLVEQRRETRETNLGISTCGQSNAAWQLECSLSLIISKCQQWQSSFDPDEHLVLLWCVCRLAKDENIRESLLQHKVISVLWDVYRKGTYIDGSEDRRDGYVRTTQSLLAIALVRLTDGRLSLSMVGDILSSLLSESIESSELSVCFELIEIHLWEIIECLHKVCSSQESRHETAGAREVEQLLFVGLAQRLPEVEQLQEDKDDLQVHNILSKWEETLVCWKAALQWFMNLSQFDVPAGGEATLIRVERCIALFEKKNRMVQSLVAEYVSIVQGELVSTSLLERSRATRGILSEAKQQQHLTKMKFLENHIESE
eukprot:745898-Hanusia_phi.AAC.2